jgi:hypothetical protein
MRPATWEDLLEFPRAGDHLAFVYEDDHYLAENVTRWAGASLAAGGGAILVGTPRHTELIRNGLRKGGLAVDALERESRLMIIDADWLMARFILDGTPSATQFRALSREIIGRVKENSNGEVRAWGEMVSLLRARGKPETAHRLEELWNVAIAEHQIALLCSYAQEGPHDHARSDGLLSKIVESHPHVLAPPPAHGAASLLPGGHAANL